jgi:hypothetical protein
MVTLPPFLLEFMHESLSLFLLSLEIVFVHGLDVLLMEVLGLTLVGHTELDF